jgi:hypothetical protein
MTSPQSLPDLDIKAILATIEQKYRVKLPRRVIATDYGEKGDLYVGFKHVEKPIGEATKDGMVVFFYEDGKRAVVAVEIMDISKLS